MPKIWLFILFAFILSLIVWAVCGVSEIQHQIAIFAIVGVILTAITSVLTIVINNKETKERDLNLLIMKEKQKVFEHFYAAFFELIKNSKNGQPSKKAIAEMYEFKRGLMNWGSEDLITMYFQYENGMEEAAQTGTTAILDVGDRFLKCIRKELGFDDKGTVNIMSIILDTATRRELVG